MVTLVTFLTLPFFVVFVVNSLFYINTLRDNNNETRGNCPPSWCI